MTSFSSKGELPQELINAEIVFDKTITLNQRIQRLRHYLDYVTIDGTKVSLIASNTGDINNLSTIRNKSLHDVIRYWMSKVEAWKEWSGEEDLDPPDGESERYDLLIKSELINDKVKYKLQVWYRKVNYWWNPYDNNDEMEEDIRYDMKDEVEVPISNLREILSIFAKTKTKCIASID